MFPDADDKAKSVTVREQGLQYLAQSIRPSQGIESLPAAVNAVTAMILQCESQAAQAAAGSDTATPKEQTKEAPMPVIADLEA